MNSQLPALQSLFEAHSGKVSDKWSIYIAEYDRLFQPYRTLPVCLLEIGIQNGGSLEIWSKFFPAAGKLVGCDINPDCAQLQFDDARIAVVVANANTDEAQQRILAHSPGLDIIIDDGSHQSADIVRSFARYFAHLNDGGLYIAEDLHCSYWQEFQGGIFQPYSSIAFFKLLADTINHEHWGVDKTRSELLRGFNRKYDTSLDEATLSHIHSIEFVNSMCIIKKALPSNNVLGSRFIAGKSAVVDGAPVALHGSNGSHPDQSSNQWSSRARPIEEELIERIQEVTNLSQSISERDRNISSFHHTVAEREQAHLAQLGQAQQQIESQLQQLAAREKAFSEQLQEVQQAHERQKGEQSHEHAVREQAYLAQLGQAQQQIESQLHQLAAREKAFSEQLQEVQQAHERQKGEQNHEHAEREQAYLAQLGQAQQKIESQLQQLAAREKAFSEHLQEVQQAHQRQKGEQSHEYAECEQAYLAQLGQAQQKIENQLQQLATREKAFSEQMLEVQQVHERQKGEQNRQHAQLEQAHHAQLTKAWHQIEAQLLQFAVREQEFSQQLLDMQRAHEQQNGAQSRAHTSQEKALLERLLTRQGELNDLTCRCVEAEKMHLLALSELRSELTGMRCARSWRWTAPFRVIAAVLGQKDTPTFKTEQPAVSEVPANVQVKTLAAQPIDTPSTFAATPNTNHRIFDMTLNHTCTVATTLEELLSHDDEQFIYSAYRTLLGRAPDSEGMHYYLRRVRAGVHKLEILAQLRISAEGNARPIKIRDLDESIKSYKYFKIPFIGAVLRLFKANEGDLEIGRELRAMNNKLSVLDSQVQRRLTEISDNFSRSVFASELDKGLLSIEGGTALSEERRAMLQQRPYDPIGDRYREALEEIKTRLFVSQRILPVVARGVKISVVMPVYKVPLKYLVEAVSSVKFQTYDFWELCIVDDGSNEVELADYLRKIAVEDARIKVKIDHVNRGISAATNAAIALTSGEFIAFLDNDDVLTLDALSCIAEELALHPEADLVYSDECKINEDGNPTELFSKPDWSPITLFNCMYSGHFSVYRRTIINKVGGLRSAYDFSQDYDLALRVSEVTQNVRHIGKFLYGWRMVAGSGAQGDKPYARASNILALQDAGKRRGFAGEAVPEKLANHFRVSATVISQTVTIVIPSDNIKNIQASIKSILQSSNYTNYEIIVVTNSKIIRQLRLEDLPTNLLFVPFDKQFNFSEKCNVGAKEASGEIIIFFNDDVRVISRDWIEMILAGFIHRGVGIVGPKLLYENYLIQHAGMVTGVRGLVGTAFHCLPHETDKHFGSALWLREVSLICGACLAIKADIFKKILGFDGINAPISHSDVDLCFRVRDAGYTCVYTPHATLIHIGHMSIGETEKIKSPVTKCKKFRIMAACCSKYICLNLKIPKHNILWFGKIKLTIPLSVSS